MNILNIVPIVELLIFLTVLICIVLLIKMLINRKKMVKLDEELSHIRNINNIIKDEKYIEMTLPFSPFI
ncbi:MAG: hypothetical protein IKE10_00100 [Bacilli bacterium]|nr:hypothetical protein [Bacilli bacterium]